MVDAPLEGRVADALLCDKSVLELMQHPKLSAAIARLKTEPSAFRSMCSEDVELAGLFAQLQGAMAEKEGEVAASRPGRAGRATDAAAVGTAGAAGARALPAARGTRGASGASDEPPPLQSEEAAGVQQARAEGAFAFEAKDYAAAVLAYEQCVSVEPSEHIHWSNLAIARLRAGDARGAADAATRCVELNPRHAKG